MQVGPVDREIVRFVDRFSRVLQHDDVTPKCPERYEAIPVMIVERNRLAGRAKLF